MSIQILANRLEFFETPVIASVISNKLDNFPHLNT